MKKKPHWKEEELSQEEKDYREAIELFQSIDCVTRFERKVLALHGAAEIFRRLENYKDSPEQLLRCEELIEKEQCEGTEQVYRDTLALQEAARTKLDYKTVLSEYQRIENMRDVPHRMEECKKEIIRLESRTTWRNRGILLGILLAFVAIFWISPAKPYTKGLIHKHQGAYALAILNFREAGSFINSPSMIESCRFQQAQQAYEKGKTNRALWLCRQAMGKKDANLLAAKIEVELLNETLPGDTIRFGMRRWVVLDKETDRVLLLLNSGFRQHIYDSSQEKTTSPADQKALDGTQERINDWKDTWIRKWLRRKFQQNVFTASERKLLLEIPVATDAEILDKVFLLDSKEYAMYESLIPTNGQWWLRSTKENYTEWINEKSLEGSVGLNREEKNVRPAVWVSLDLSLLEESD